MAGPEASQQATIDWRRLAADKNVAIDVARVLWEQAKATGADPVARSNLFRRLIDEAAKNPGAAQEPGKSTQVDSKGPTDPASLGPGKTTEVLLKAQAQGAAAKPDATNQAAPQGANAAAAKDAAPGADANKKDQAPTAPPTVDKLRSDLVAAAQAAQDAAAILATADSATIVEVLKQLRAGSPNILQKVLTVAGAAIERILGQQLPDPAQAKADAPGIRVPFVGGEGEVHTHFMTDEGVPMVSTPMPVPQKVDEWRAEVLRRHPADQESFAPMLVRASGLSTSAGEQAKKAKLGDEPAKTALPDTQKQLAATLGTISRELTGKPPQPATPAASLAANPVANASATTPTATPAPPAAPQQPSGAPPAPDAQAGAPAQSGAQPAAPQNVGAPQAGAQPGATHPGPAPHAAGAQAAATDPAAAPKPTAANAQNPGEPKKPEDEAKNPDAPKKPAVPTSLVAKHISAKASNPTLERAIFGLKGSQDFGKGGDPAQVTKTLLAAHPEASMAETGALTLPAANAAAIGAATTLEGVASAIMAATGVSKVRLSNPDGQSLEITVGINPEIQLGKLEPNSKPLGATDLQRMAAAARAVIAQNDAALKTQMLNSPTKIKRVVVGAGYAAVATYVTLPEAERAQTIGVGFADPWSLRSDLLMGQTAEYLQVAGFPSLEEFSHVKQGGYLPSSVFADTTALARAQAGMAVFPGWAGQSENFDAAVHAAGATDAAKDLNLKQETKKVDDADITAQAEANAAQDEAAKQEKRIKPIATADEHMNQKGVANGRTLIVGAGAAAAWNVQKVRDGSGDYAWIGRPAATVPGMTPSQPRGEILLRESFLGATGGGNRNASVFDWSKMFLGEASKIEITKPTQASAMQQPKFDTPGANPEPPQRTPEQKKEPWQASPEYKVRVPINMNGTTVIVYTQNLDLASGPGPARKLNVGANIGDVMDPANPRRGKVQLTPETAGKGDKLALPEEIEIDVGTIPGDRDGRDDGVLPAPPSGKFGQVVLSIGQDVNAPGGINDLIKNNGIITKIIWDRVMADPATEWNDQRSALPPASPLGVENKALGIRVLGAAATDGPGLSPADATLYKLAQNAHLGRIGDAGGRAEGGVSRLAGTFQAANTQVNGGPATALLNAGENTAPAPTGEHDGKVRQPAQLDPNFVPALRENDAQKAAAFARRMEGYVQHGLTTGEDAGRVKQQAESLQQGQPATPPETPQQQSPPQQSAPQQQPTGQETGPQQQAAAGAQAASQQLQPRQQTSQDAAQQQPQQATPQQPDEVTPTPADPIVETTTMAGAPHTLTADPARGNIDFHSVAGFAIQKLQSVVDLVPPDIRQKVSLALAKAVEATALVADPALKLGAKPSDRPPLVQRLGAKLRELAVAIRVFGDTGNLTDSDPATVERARLDAEAKRKRQEEAAAIAKKAADDAKQQQQLTLPDVAEPAAVPAVAPAPTATSQTALPDGPLQPAAAPAGPKKDEDGKQKIASPGVARDDGPLFAGTREADQGFAQANDAREYKQTAQGAEAKPQHAGIAVDGKQETVAEAAARLHPDTKRDSHFNPVEKVKFERALAAALLANAPMYAAPVNLVSARIKDYLESRREEALKEGLENAHQMYETDLAGLTKSSSPGWWGAVALQGTEDNQQLGDMTLHSLAKGSLPQKLAVHQNMYGVLAFDFQYRQEITRRILGVAAQEPWFIRQQTKLKDGKFDPENGSSVFKKHDAKKNDPEAAAAEAERGRVARLDTGAVSPAAPGIQARDVEGNAPSSILPGFDTQMVYRGIDAFTMDEAKGFCQRARLVLNMPLAAGVSGSTAELIGVANTLGLSIDDQKKYAIAVLAYIGGGGNHSYHEIAVVLAAAGLIGTPDDYSGVKSLVGPDLFDSLKQAHPGAFKDEKPDAGVAP